jgi:2-(1,2-epoxy-1,2-dihydrophenyl)acetyl-CoA isomerase
MEQEAAKFENILYEVKPEGSAWITLNRPEALNSFTGVMLGELAQAFGLAAQNDGVRVVVITGAGRAFCAGQDLRANPEAIQDLRNWLASTYRPMLTVLQALKKPSVAVVNGVAAGAGFSLSLACDFRVASSKARFVPAFGKIALVPDSGMSHFLPRLIGFSRALELLSLNRDLTGEEAYTWGLVNRVCPPEQLVEVTGELAGQLAQASPLAYALTRELFQRSPGLDLAGALSLEEDFQGQAGASADFKEGLAAFEEKRLPRFRGK